MTPDTRPRPPETPDRPDRPAFDPRVVWTKGPECRTLAEILGGPEATPAGPDIVATCIERRATLVVTRHLGSLDVCSVAVPDGFDPDATRSVVAAVGGGPHSHLAAAVADRLSRRLGVPARAVYGHRGPEERERAERVLADIAASVPHLTTEAVEAPSPASMVDSLPSGALLVVGAPGGSWFQRQFFGPGARIRAKAPHGTIVVRHSPTRVYQVMQPPVAFGPQMFVEDARLLATGGHIIVAEDGKLVGTVSRTRLSEAGARRQLAEVMEEPIFLAADEPVAEVAHLVGGDRGSPIPVVDGKGRLVGIVDTAIVHRGGRGG